ncbi:hypothetical protein ELZ19_06970 [Brucella abortus]|uniref:dihydrofolate reductase family protein n=1 Tax=Brucella abortus TaxID=235 RepID=UPI0004E8B5E1|nr:hypothetical protein [Brucella abortus]KFH18455.1 hypothetical protein IB60_17275 [Brucella abortus LMN1]RUQ67312.1 hypothetical protein ELZ23_15400 [Brucella abortus]RUQ78557.1 hypothetical protein ELZ22_16925 [Brucella abortus]RUQ88299.1 hypothetical protein ELZ18_15680 [Brucella abortus]RUQ90329.1 hypothetical protein ELZ20_15680 [Brucella abortus]
MRLVMATSRDGWMARRADDDMSWLGATDKAVFRILTGVDGTVAVGSRTAEHMPRTLGGRRVLVLSASGRRAFQSWGTLEDFHRVHPDGWLIGGPSLALLALERGYVDEVHLCRSDRFAFPDPEARAVEDVVTPWLSERSEGLFHREGWRREMETTLLDVTVECWRRRRG